MEKSKKNKKIKLIDLQKNLNLFHKILHSNCIIFENKLSYNFKDIVFDLTDNFENLNFIVINHDNNVIDQILFFLKNKKETLCKTLELKKKTNDNSIFLEFEISLLELELKHLNVIISVVINNEKKKIRSEITLEHIEKFFKTYGFANIYALVIDLILDDFTFYLENYLKKKEYMFFDKEIEFLELQKEFENHLIYLKKLFAIKKHEIFLEKLENELFLLETKNIKKKQEFEQLFFLFQKIHYSKLVKILKNEEKKKFAIFDSQHIENFYKEILLLKLSCKMESNSETFVSALKNQIKNFKFILQRMFIKTIDGYKIPEFDFLNEIVLFRKKYFIELTYLIQKLPKISEEEIKKFLEEHFLMINQQFLSIEKLESFEYKFLEIELEQYYLLCTSIETKNLEINKKLVLLENFWEIAINEQKISKCLTDFVYILSFLRNIGTLQTEKGNIFFQECKVKLFENLGQWETVWKQKEIQSFPKIVQVILSNVAETLSSNDALDQLFFNITRKHFKIILEELEKAGEEKEYLIIDFSYIFDFLDEFLILKGCMLED